MNGPSGETVNSSSALFLSVFCPCWPGLLEGDISSFVGRGGGGGGGGGEMGDDSSEEKEQGEQVESAGLGTGRGAADAVSVATG